MAVTVDTERVKQKIALIQEKMRKEANPQLLSEYRLLLKKEISFFRRSWAAAYLLMLYDQGQGQQNPRWEKGEGFRSKTKGPGRNENSKTAYRDNGGDRRNQGAAPESAYGPLGKFVLTEEESKRLFISIGRNRRLFPREILGLIINAAQVEREDIGSIRILDSYSFVQVRTTVADKIIEALNGTLFRGRTLAVNYAHSKREGGSPGKETDNEADSDRGIPDEISDETADGADEMPEPDDEPEWDGETAEESPDLSLGTEQDDDPGDEEGV
ncbi:MAG: DbpA RNA binding domain-containing protein [Treponema sp.]|jgi:hypothetical protein|nr:DbpA RNA binding domain-containing protein [Treponema sp.]